MRFRVPLAGLEPATCCLGELTEAAAQAGVAVLSAEVLPQNHRMLHLFRDSGIPVTTRTIPGVVLVDLATSPLPAALAHFQRCDPPSNRAPFGQGHAGSLRPLSMR
jgi:hypothetical protein